MKIKLPYRTTSKLAEYILTKQAQRTIETGEAVTIGSIEHELAEYCHISRHTIRAIKSEDENIPSLPLAFKIAEYFNEDVSKIFFLKDE